MLRTDNNLIRDRLTSAPYGAMTLILLALMTVSIIWGWDGWYLEDFRGFVGNHGPAKKEKTVIHQIKAGDNFETLARRYYFDAARWQDIMLANPRIVDEEMLRVGDDLRIPRVEYVVATNRELGESIVFNLIPILCLLSIFVLLFFKKRALQNSWSDHSPQIEQVIEFSKIEKQESISGDEKLLDIMMELDEVFLYKTSTSNRLNEEMIFSRVSQIIDDEEQEQIIYPEPRV